MNQVVARPQFVSRPREEDRTTRKHLPWWDRVKFLFLLAVVFGFFVWAEAADNPILPVSEAFRIVAESKRWIFVLFGLELVRQIHFLIAEHWSAYYFFWERRFGGFNRVVDSVNPWTRFRIARIFKWMLAIALLNAFVAWRNEEAFFQQLATLPQTIGDFLFSTGQELPFIFQLGFIMVIAVGQFVLIFWFLSRGGTEVYMPDDVKTRFADVWGQDAVLEKVQENLIFLEDPESIESKGGYVPAGILLYGPPGTGKTLMAEAVAGETGKPYVFVEPGAFTNMFFGVGILKVRSLFKKLRKLSLKFGGVIAFFDEADALGNRGQLAGMPGQKAPAMANDGCNSCAYLSESAKSSLLYAAHMDAAHADAVDDEGPKRNRIAKFMMGGMGGGGGDTMALQALLAELSGLKKPRGFFNRSVRRLLGMKPKPPPKFRMLIMMATNMPDSLDAALLRPGRIDRIYKVGYPAKEGRKRTYEGYFSKVSNVLTDADLEKLATISPYATGASIKDIVNEALVNAIREGRDTVTWPDVLKAKHLKEHGLPDDFEYIERERHATAIHEACHALAFYRLDAGSSIDVATIERRGDVGGFVAPIPIEDQMFTWRSERENDIMIFLASLAGERMFFDGDSSVGVGGDLRSATTIAMQMEGFWAMGSTVASHHVTKVGQVGQVVATGTDRMWLDTPFGERIEAKLESLLARVSEILERDRALVLALAHALELYKTVPGEDVVAIFEGGVGPTIDGRAYQNPAFMAEIEEYHTMALAAHKAVGKVSVPLPVPTAQGQHYGVSPRSYASAPPMFVDSEGKPIVGQGIGGGVAQPFGAIDRVVGNGGNLANGGNGTTGGNGADGGVGTADPRPAVGNGTTVANGSGEAAATAAPKKNGNGSKNGNGTKNGNGSKKSGNGKSKSR